MEASSELIAPRPLEVELDPRERVLVRVGAISGAELSDLAEDGGSVPSARLEVSEPASLMPGHPEADQLGVVEDRLGDVVAQLLVVVVDGPLGVFPVGVSEDVVGNRVPECRPAAVTAASPGLMIRCR